jgi:hypothetical protein
LDKAAGWLFLMVEQEQRVHFQGIQDSPVKMWEALEAVHRQKKAGMRFNAYDELFSIRKLEIFYHETLEYYHERSYVYEDEEMEARRARRVSISPYLFLLLSVSFIYVSLIQFHSSVR